MFVCRCIAPVGTWLRAGPVSLTFWLGLHQEPRQAQPSGCTQWPLVWVQLWGVGTVLLGGKLAGAGWEWGRSTDSTAQHGAGRVLGALQAGAARHKQLLPFGGAHPDCRSVGGNHSQLICLGAKSCI